MNSYLALALNILYIENITFAKLSLGEVKDRKQNKLVLNKITFNILFLCMFLYLNFKLQPFCERAVRGVKITNC